MNIDFEPSFPRMVFMRILPTACFLSVLCTSLAGYSQGYGKLPDARPAIRAMYQPAPVPDQTGWGPEEVEYYPFRLY